MQNNKLLYAACKLIDKMKLPFRKDKELYLSLYKILGFYPHNIQYYKVAMLHKSVARRNAKRGQKPVNNERLEFLGDAILDAIVGDIVYRHFPGKREGFLTNTRSKLVQRETLNRLADEMGVTNLVKSAGHISSHNSYMGGNAFEALVGALYLDRGYDACMRFMKKRILAQMINIDKVAYKEVNFKSKLIEWSQKNRIEVSFDILEQKKEESGSPKFRYVVTIEGLQGCEGEGYSKKESQQKASKATLEKLRKEPKFLDEVFAAKTRRKKMEEEPVQDVPSTNVQPAFIISNKPQVEEKRENAFTEKVFTEQESAMGERSSKIKKMSKQKSEKDEFDLSDISAKERSDEDIIAAAEEAAYNNPEN
jgi:ribonuclease-3